MDNFYQRKNLTIKTTSKTYESKFRLGVFVMIGVKAAAVVEHIFHSFCKINFVDAFCK
jgi:hypothetical protein